MPAYHAPERVVGVGGRSGFRHGGGRQAIQGVVGEDRQAASGIQVRSRGGGDGVPQPSVGIVPVGGGHALLVDDGPEGVLQSGVVGPEAVGSAYGGGVGMSGRNEPGYPQEGIVVVAGLRDAVTRGGGGQGAVGIGRRQVRGTQQASGLAHAIVLGPGDDVARAGSCPRLYLARQAVEGGGRRFCDERGFYKMCSVRSFSVESTGLSRLTGKTGAGSQVRKPGTVGTS